jgi:hypothetical protein
MEDKDISIRVIVDAKDILSIEYQWNTLVNESSRNPFLLSEFVVQFMKYIPRNWTPMIIVMSDKSRIVGIAPLKTKMSILGRYFEFLHPSWCSEFIFDEQYRNQCVNYLLDFLFNKLKCKFASFALSGESPYLDLLNQQHISKRIHLTTAQEMSHRVVPINSSWTEFEASRTKNFGRQYRRIKRSLDKAGSWKVIRVEGKEQSEIVDRILNIEERSWKETLRTQEGETDWLLTLFLSASERLAKIEPNFKWGVWFLELKGKVISYQLSIEYKEIVYFVKTSYDNEYRQFYPGIIVQHFAIQDQFAKRQNKCVDFVSDLPYQQKWTDVCLSRLRIQLTKGTLPTFIQLVLNNAIARKGVRYLFSFLNHD